MDNPIKAEYAGGETEYVFSFPFLEASFVKVLITNSNGAEQDLTYEQDYTIDGNKVKLYVNTDTSDTVTIYRQTSTERLVKFNDGSVLREVDLTMLQLQLLHTIEERGTFTVGTETETQTVMQIERVVTLADDVVCERGTLLGYKAGGYVRASNLDYSSLRGVCVALNTPQDNKVRVMSIGQYGTNEFADGKTCFVGDDGNIVDTPPITSGSYIKTIGFMEGNVLMFQPDTVSIRLA